MHGILFLFSNEREFQIFGNTDLKFSPSGHAEKNLKTTSLIKMTSSYEPNLKIRSFFMERQMDNGKVYWWVDFLCVIEKRKFYARFVHAVIRF